MKNQTYHSVKWLLVFIMGLFLLPATAQAAVKIYDCNGQELKPATSALARNHTRRAEKALSEINKTKCLPTRDLNYINNHVKSQGVQIKMDCSANPDCGQAPHGSNTILIPRNYRSMRGGCGCEEATILHEMLHSYAMIPDTGWGHKKIEGCETKCTAGIRNCQRYPPPTGGGQPCDCI